MKRIKVLLISLSIFMCISNISAKDSIHHSIKNDPSIMNTLLIKMDSLENKIESIKQNTEDEKLWSVGLDWYNVWMAFFALLIGGYCGWVDTKGYRQSKKTADNVIRVLPEIQEKQFADLIRHLYRNLVCTVAMGRRIMENKEHCVYPSEEHLTKLKLIADDVIHLDIYNHDMVMYNAMHEMKLLMRNYDIEIDVALMHMKCKDVDMEALVNDLDTLFFKPLYLISRIMEVSLLMYNREIYRDLDRCRKILNTTGLSEKRKKTVENKVNELEYTLNIEKKKLLEKSVGVFASEHVKKVKDDHTDNPMKNFFDIHYAVRENHKQDSERVDFPFDGLRRSINNLMKFYSGDIDKVRAENLVDNDGMKIYSKNMKEFIGVIRDRNDNGKMVSEILNTNDDMKLIMEYDMKKILLFLLSVDVAIEYGKIHIIKM